MKTTIIRDGGKITEHPTVADALRVVFEEFGIHEVTTRKCSHDEIVARGSIGRVIVKGKSVATIMIH